MVSGLLFFTEDKTLLVRCPFTWTPLNSDHSRQNMRQETSHVTLSIRPARKINVCKYASSLSNSHLNSVDFTHLPQNWSFGSKWLTASTRISGEASSVVFVCSMFLIACFKRQTYATVSFNQVMITSYFTNEIFDFVGRSVVCTGGYCYQIRDN